MPHIRPIVSPASILDQCTDEIIVESTLHNPSYLRQDAFAQFLHRDQVVATISAHLSFRDAANLQKFADYATENPRVFLTLAATKLVAKTPLLFSAKFVDSCLPVRCQFDGEGTLRVYSEEDDQNRPWTCFAKVEDEKNGWDVNDIKLFVSRQWLFMAVLFENNCFKYDIHKNRPLPYISLAATEKAHLGNVIELGLQREHITPISGRFLPLASYHPKSPYRVAVKQIRVNGATEEELTKFFDKEAATLKTMRELQHPHLIKAISAYKKGSDRSFVFPWAPGGNLHQFWGRSTQPADEEVTRWALHQIRGLVDGLNKLHTSGICHGGLKPENILIFDSNENSQDHLLVIADVGIAKFHAEVTRQRQVMGYHTTNKFGTLPYEPPEIEQQTLISRKNDSWSLGCIILEFIIWLVQGSPGQLQFHNDRLNTGPRVDRFWDREPNGQPVLHPAVTKWVTKELPSHLMPGTALRDLLDLVSTSLLIGSVQDRTSINDFLQGIDDYNSAKPHSAMSSSQWITPDSDLTRPSESVTEVTGVFSMPMSQHPPLVVTVYQNPGHDTMSPAMSVDAATRDEDKDSVMSVLTDGTEIHLPIEDRDDLISAFVRDLRQDIDLLKSRHGAAIDDLIVSRLPSLLKAFTLRLDRHTRSDVENKAKRLIRQQRENISRHLREDHALDYEGQTKSKGPPGMSPREKIDWARWDPEGNFDPLPTSLVMEEHVVVEEPDEPELDREEQSDPKLYRQVRSFLVGGPAYHWLIENVQSSFTLTEKTGTAADEIAQRMDKMISSTLHRPSRFFQEIEAEFRIDWDLWTFLKSEEYDSLSEEAAAFENIVTVTGTIVDAQALVCKDYMRQTWPSSGHKILDLFQNALQSAEKTHECLLDDGTKLKVSLNPPSQQEGSTLVLASGDRAALTELCEQLAWLGSVLRPSPVPVGTCVVAPQAVFQKHTNEDRPKILVDMTFDMNPVPQGEVQRQEAGTCWHHMFRNLVIVEGFPIPIRLQNERGLEIPFELMTALAETDFATYWDDTYLLKGASTMLVPTWRHYRATLVWHFLSNPQGQRMPYYAFRERCSSWLEIEKTSISWSTISHMRNFVGWASDITRHLGTKDINYGKIDYTFAQRLSPGTVVEQKLTISASKWIGASFALRRGDRDGAIAIQNSLWPTHMRNAREMSVLIYDGEAKRGWLVDGASALLCLVRTQVAQRKHLCFDESQFDEEQFPHLHESAGPDAAKNMLLDDKTLMLIIRRTFLSYEMSDKIVTASQTEPPPAGAEQSSEIATSGKSSTAPEGTIKYETATIRDLIANAWGTLEQIRDRHQAISTDHTIAQLPDILSLLSGNKQLHGYSFQDIVRSRSELSPRMIRLSSNGKKWVKFTKQIKSVVLFGKNFGELYKPAQGLRSCEDWMNVPPSCEYLAVPISLLKEIKEQNHNDGHVPEESADIAPGFALYGPENVFQPCGRNCHHKFDPVLNFRHGDKIAMNSIAFNNGAVLLGRSSFLDTNQRGRQSTFKTTSDDNHSSGICLSRENYSGISQAEALLNKHAKGKHTAQSIPALVLSEREGDSPGKAMPNSGKSDSSPGPEACDMDQMSSRESLVASAREDSRYRKKSPTHGQQLDQPEINELHPPAATMDSKGKDPTQAKSHRVPLPSSEPGSSSRDNTPKAQNESPEERGQHTSKVKPGEENTLGERRVESKIKGGFRTKCSQMAGVIKGLFTRKLR